MHLEKALAINPRSANVHAFLGRALAEQGKLSKALMHLEQALKIKPKHADAQQIKADVKRRIAEGE